MQTDRARTEGAEREDAGLVRLVAQGSEGALASLYDRHAASVLRVALGVLRDRGTAEDVVQETFLALWDRADSYDPSLGSTTTWLLTIARNRAIDRLRAASRRVPAGPISALVSDERDAAATIDWLVASGDVLAAGAPEPGPEVALASSETRAAVVAAIGTLDGLERQTILLAYRDGLSQSEIAERLGWPIGTVKTRSRRALRRLRTVLEAGGALEAEGALEPDDDECCEEAPGA